VRGSGPADRYRSAVEALGSGVDESLVSIGDFTQAGGMRPRSPSWTVAPTSTRSSRPPTSRRSAWFARCARPGVASAEDVTVIGFDDIPEAADQEPPLTTVRQPIAALGTAMTRLLLDRIEGRADLPRRTVLPVELVRRQTA
jgi:LacI family transcriptional regulator